MCVCVCAHVHACVCVFEVIPISLIRPFARIRVLDPGKPSHTETHTYTYTNHGIPALADHYV